MQQANYDIVIVGGGLVGTAMAIAVAGIAQRYQLKIAIIDGAKTKSSESKAANSLDGRATALALGSRNLLERVGVWSALEAYAQPIFDIDVSDQGQPFGVQMQAQEMGQEALGYVLQNEHMGNVFRHQLSQHCEGLVTFINEAQVLSLDNSVKDSQLVYEHTLEGETQQVEVTCQLIIMADGGRSSLRADLGMHSQNKNYEQVAVVVNVALDKAHQGLACERFTADGPMAVLPLLPEQGQYYAAIVWTQPADQAATLAAMDDEEMRVALQNQIGFRMGEFRALGARQIYPLALSVAEEQARQGLAVIGNAAHTLHPIAGQGFNLALRGVFALAEQVYKACQAQAPLGDLTYLNAFLATSSRDQKMTVHATDQIMQLFSSRQKTLTWGRQLGLLAMQNIPLAKTVFTRTAMGLDQPLADVLPLPVRQV